MTNHNVGVQLYMDGALVVNVNDPGTALTDNGSGQLFIGGNPQGDATSATLNRYRAWNGGIDDVGMWNRPLSAAEVGEIYAAGQLGLIPEPTSGLLSLLGLGLALRRRR